MNNVEKIQHTIVGLSTSCCVGLLVLRIFYLSIAYSLIWCLAAEKILLGFARIVFFFWIFVSSFTIYNLLMLPVDKPRCSGCHCGFGDFLVCWVVGFEENLGEFVGMEWILRLEKSVALIYVAIL